MRGEQLRCARHLEDNGEVQGRPALIVLGVGGADAVLQQDANNVVEALLRCEVEGRLALPVDRASRLQGRGGRERGKGR